MRLPPPPLRFPASQFSRPDLSERARLPPGQPLNNPLPSPGKSAPHYAPRVQPAQTTTNGFSSVGDCIHNVAPTITISKRRIKQLDSIQLIRDQRDNRQQQLAFHARPFVLCGLPLRRPPRSQLVHSRHSGNFFLHVTAHPDFGLPFGQDSLIPIWVATLALQQKNRTIQPEFAD
jgi:hypothetical protein